MPVIYMTRVFLEQYRGPTKGFFGTFFFYRQCRELNDTRRPICMQPVDLWPPVLISILVLRCWALLFLLSKMIIMFSNEWNRIMCMPNFNSFNTFLCLFIFPLELFFKKIYRHGFSRFGMNDCIANQRTKCRGVKG